MRNLKKVLALVIAFSMMLSVVAFAGYPDVPADADYADAVELLSALDIIKGDDLGKFNPDNTITRAEAAAVVCRALGLENSAAGAKGITAFTDVAADHWATGYINLATQNGVINGHGDGTFGPEDPVTYEQMVKMLVCALGFEPMAAQKGGYPTGYLVVANNYKMTAGVTATVEAPRKTVAQLVANALSTPKMDQTSYGVNAEWEVLDGKNDRDYATLLTDMDIYIASGIVGAKDLAEDTVAFTVMEDSDDFEFEEEDTPVFEINGTNIADYETQYVDVYVKKDSRNDYAALAVVASDMGETLTILSDDIKEVDGNKVEYYVDGTSKTKTIKVADLFGYSWNKGRDLETGYVVEALADLEDLVDDVELKFVENTGDSYFDLIIATSYESKRVADVDEDRIKFDNKWLEIDYEDETVEYLFYAADGSELELKDFAEDDVVAIVANDSTLSDATYIRMIKLTDKAITGTVTETATQSGKDYVWINGEKYEDATGDLKNEDEGTFFVGMTGKIFDFEGSSAAGNFAYIIEAAKSNKAFADDVWEVKLLTIAGDVAEFTVNDDLTVEFGDYLNDLFDDDAAISDEWLYKDNYDKVNKDRIITYKTNSKGEIKSFAAASETADRIKDDINGAYKAKTQKLDGVIVEDDTVIFDVTGTKAESLYATDIKYLVDDSDYQAIAVEVDDEVKLIVITNGEARISDEAGFAIVTDVRETTADGEEIYVVSYIQDMEEGKVTFNEDSDEIAGTATFAYEDLEIGDVFVFNADADGIVNTYAVLAEINAEGLFDIYVETLQQFSEDNEFIYGFIASEESESKKKDTFVVGGNLGVDDVSIDAETNTYSYYTTKRNVEIKKDYLAEDADWYKETVDDDEEEATFFFARLLDEETVDIYTINERVVGLAEITAAALEAVYVNNSEVGGGVTANPEKAKVEAAIEVEDVIDALPAVDEIELEDAAAIAEARAAYDALEEDEAIYVAEEYVEALVAAEAKIAELEAAAEAAANQAAAQGFADLVAAIGTVTAESEPAIVAAEAAYADLTDAQKALDTAVAAKATLDAARTAYDELAALTPAQEVEALIDALPAADAGDAALEAVIAEIEAAHTAYENLGAAQSEVAAEKVTKLEALWAWYNA